ncbi:hypothetical protein [Bhargavaea cecembensis]|uniref:hypothetical protein n=1 Tax=Bhargavaea cecembensis TaxID=394098 RepID=UPI0015CF1126|nr:hypothetical protein [Bhargavaea cecembensis]
MDEKNLKMICDLETGVCKPADGEETPKSGLIDLSAAPETKNDEESKKDEENGEAR